MENEAEVRWTLGDERFVHATATPTRFVRDLFEQHGEAVDHLEVRRASLEDTYITMVQQHESGMQGDAVAELAARAGSTGDPHRVAVGEPNEGSTAGSVVDGEVSR